MALRPVLLAAAALLVLPAAASAVTPKPKAIVVAHQHGTHGHDYHVELDVDQTAKRLTIAVLYLQECHETTAAEQDIALGPDGSFDVEAQLPKGAGTWSIRGTFVSPTHASGTYSMTRGGDCDIEDAPFDATVNGHVILGNPFDYPPKAIEGTSADARRLRLLARRVRAQAPRFSTPAKAAREGYVLSTKAGCPGMHHARKHGVGVWGPPLNPGDPQALVYWCDDTGRYTLAAFMFREPTEAVPNTYSGLLQWHKHRFGATWMTHVWLVPNAMGSFATCAPFAMFQAYSILSYEPYYIDTMVDKPCGDTPNLAE